jgi:UDP-N-acetyl-D-mannosaminuronate dehydrogenase
MKKVLMMGLGEVGSAIKQVEEEAGNEVHVLELDRSPNLNDYDVMHVCIPYSEKFQEYVLNALLKYTPALIIINSTVKLNTTSELRQKISDKNLNIPIVHSLVRGVHPNLYSGIKTFVKYVGGELEDCNLAIEHWSNIGVDSRRIGESVESELAKIMSTTYYGWNILFAKQVDRICKEHGLDFEAVYTEPNLTYNDGYIELDKPEVIRPVLTAPSGKLGGHCVAQNFELLPESKLKMFAKILNECDNDDSDKNGRCEKTTEEKVDNKEEKEKEKC